MPGETPSLTYCWRKCPTHRYSGKHFDSVFVLGSFLALDFWGTVGFFCLGRCLFFLNNKDWTEC
jgi:hypothetical protein